MSRKLVLVVLVMLVLTGAMGLKTAVMAHSKGSLIMANGTGPTPIWPPKTVSAPSSVTPN